MNHNPIQVLLIDDEPAQVWLVREYLAEATTKTGQVIQLQNVELLADGLQQLAEKKFDVLLLDLSLPDSVGRETFQRVRQQFPALPVVVLTSLEDEDMGVQLIQAGAQDYLVKGQINGFVLYRTLLHAIERQQAEAERIRLIEELKRALAQVKTLRGLLPICAGCKKIRDDSGYWNQIEVYIMQHSDAQFSHGLCPDCLRRLYPGLRPD